jgi:hypothetical protein
VARIQFGDRSIALPSSRKARIALGLGLTAAGALGGWLPILVFWLVPLGLVILSVDLPRVRRWRRRAAVAGLRWWRGTKENGDNGSGPAPPGAPPLRDSALLF